MSDTPEQQPELGFIGQRFVRLLDDVGMLRHDVNVLSAVVRRIAYRQARVLDEIRAMNADPEGLGIPVRVLDGNLP